MEKEIFIAVITALSTIISAFGASILTVYFNNKLYKYSNEQMLIKDIKSFAQRSLNIARELEGKECCHKMIRITRELPEYQAYHRVLNIDNDSSNICKEVKK